MNRRNFLKTGLAGTAVPALTGIGQFSLAETLSAWGSGTPEWAISDSRFTACQRFGEAAERAGLSHVAIAGDVTALWYRHLDPKWRKEPTIIAGMTARQPLFVLERLAWDRGMRVVLRVEHDWQADGSVSHSLQAPEHQLPGLTALFSGDADWNERFARLTANCSWNLARSPCGQSKTSAPSHIHNERPAALVSWIIAPSQRA
ncbi:twin-arginine translocation signal domain-containing protein [Pseudomonas aeruginosa]|uniref:twin-arginine translocation signal domain-containing protein n=1 Tax=Pseudomonas aeruginosa TaxID=287 RepID=UPI003FCF101F